MLPLLMKDRGNADIDRSKLLLYLLELDLACLPDDLAFFSGNLVAFCA